MHAMRLGVLIATLVVPFAAPGLAQAQAKAVAAPSPELFALAESRIPELRAAGVRQIVGRTTGGNVQILTTWGAAYVRWPKDVKPVGFELYINADGTNGAFANDFSAATKAQYAAALDATIPAAIKAAANARATATRPKP